MDISSANEVPNAAKACSKGCNTWPPALNQYPRQGSPRNTGVSRKNYDGNIYGHVTCCWRPNIYIYIIISYVLHYCMAYIYIQMVCLVGKTYGNNATFHTRWQQCLLAMASRFKGFRRAVGSFRANVGCKVRAAWAESLEISMVSEKIMKIYRWILLKPMVFIYVLYVCFSNN